ncbi:hypothetical protein JEQ12_009198 [Ovis aries]|uniref:Uncharacterized protein n=1 Tax=Ovis aries TaxID=9940 RepID=A0A836D8X8_SHEEP|nr:hypothetical protein JEQ12_009198 [Ovis aries]
MPGPAGKSEIQAGKVNDPGQFYGLFHTPTSAKPIALRTITQRSKTDYPTTTHDRPFQVMSLKNITRPPNPEGVKDQTTLHEKSSITRHICVTTKLQFILKRTFCCTDAPPTPFSPSSCRMASDISVQRSETPGTVTTPPTDKTDTSRTLLYQNSLLQVRKRTISPLKFLKTERLFGSPTACLSMKPHPQCDNLLCELEQSLIEAHMEAILRSKSLLTLTLTLNYSQEPLGKPRSNLARSSNNYDKTEPKLRSDQDFKNV